MPTKPTHASEEEIRALAHKFWEEDGRPEGQAESHWQRAYLALTKPATAPAKTAAKAPAAAPAVKKKSKTKPA